MSDKPTAPTIWQERFIAGLNRAIMFHGTNTNDPHGISNAVICTLIEVKNAFEESQKRESGWKS
jgi:hypothetical protein